MGLEMVLNDLSLLPLAEDIYTARQRMNTFVGTLAAAVSLKVERILRTDYDIHKMELTPGYPVARWLNDIEVDREARRYFRSLATKAPYLQDGDDSTISDRYYSSDFFYDRKKAAGLGMAFLLDALAIGFHSHSIWELSSLQLFLEQFQEDGILGSTIVTVKHACFREHVLEHRDWISKRAYIQIESGADLCSYLKTLYPYLQFCASTLAQIQALSRGEIHLRQIMKHLLDLNNY